MGNLLLISVIGSIIAIIIAGTLRLLGMDVYVIDALRKIWLSVKGSIKSTIIPILTGKRGKIYQWTSIIFLILLLGGISYGVYMHFGKGQTSTSGRGTNITQVPSPSTNDDNVEYVIRTSAKGFDTPGRLTQGIAWDGTYLWLSDNSSEIFKVDTNGKVLGAYPAPEPTPEGLAWDGSTFWIFTTNYGYIYQFSIDESSNVSKLRKNISFKSSARTFGATNHGLAWDGTNLWFSDYYNVYKINTAGNILSNFAFPYEIAGLAWDGEKLWIAYNSFPENATLVMADTKGNILGSFTAPVYHVDALTWGDGHLWAAGKDSLGGESMIYKIEVYTKAIKSPTRDPSKR